MQPNCTRSPWSVVYLMGIQPPACWWARKPSINLWHPLVFLGYHGITCGQFKWNDKIIGVHTSVNLANLGMIDLPSICSHWFLCKSIVHSSVYSLTLNASGPYIRLVDQDLSLVPRLVGLHELVQPLHLVVLAGDGPGWPWLPHLGIPSAQTIPKKNKTSGDQTYSTRKSAIYTHFGCRDKMSRI